MIVFLFVTVIVPAHEGNDICSGVMKVEVTAHGTSERCP